MDFHLWLAFAAACLVMGLIPGPGVASIIGFAFSSGRRVALISVAGMAVGNLIAISVSLAGAGVILASSVMAFAILKWTGAAYLIAIGLIAIVKSGGAVDEAAPGKAIGARAAFMTSVMVGTFHPKTVLFFVAFATQFIRPDQPYFGQAVILALTCTVIVGCTDTLYALTAARASGLIRGPRVRRWTQRAGGGVLVAAGVATAAMRR
ncbi:LysE family translocator [Sphingoaurantiacus capsulatus]|uniref:LysE family translocator n=1 Tax=Sphingoaurantiacus capsulatus TaxID=1771310 RepID=A0ABV7X5A0_9SPHN